MHRKFIEHLCLVTTKDFIVKKEAYIVVMPWQNKLRCFLNLGSLYPLSMGVLYSNLMEFSDAVQHVLVNPD